MFKQVLANRTENQRKIALKTLFLVAETYSSAFFKVCSISEQYTEIRKKTQEDGEKITRLER